MSAFVGLPPSLMVAILAPGVIALPLVPTLASTSSSKAWLAAAVLLALCAAVAGGVWKSQNKDADLLDEWGSYKETMLLLITVGVSLCVGAAAFAAFSLRSSSYQSMGMSAAGIALLVAGSMAMSGAIATSGMKRVSLPGF